ncbi:hypothetical protein GCM10010267_55760 [Streptomyces griseorubens]|nr:hypothetical protein GCM10010267_55760 [Streptomyces griseorubens]
MNPAWDERGARPRARLPYETRAAGETDSARASNRSGTAIDVLPSLTDTTPRVHPTPCVPPAGSPAPGEAAGTPYGAR